MKTTKILRTGQSSSDMHPEHSWLSRSATELRGQRTKYCITHNPSFANPGEEVYINLKGLGSTHPVDPNSVSLKFVFNRSDPTARLFNNMAANLVQRLIVNMGGETIYDNSHENLIRAYSDCWLSQRAREELPF